MASVTPQKLSSLSTSTLTAVLELTRSSQQHLTPSPTLVPKINKNLLSLHSGILDLQSRKGPEAPSREILNSLRQQYQRLCSLVEGTNVEFKTLEEAQLIEHEQETPNQGQADGRASDARSHSDHSLSRGALGSSPLIPHVSIPMDEAAVEAEQQQAQRDSESMQRADGEVHMMQRQMMDDQDATLDQLSLAISRQRDLSMNIHTELEEHNRMLEETDEAIDSTQDRLRKAAGKLERVGRRTAKDSSATCIIICLVIVLLLLIIILK